jgi:RNA polymerase I-specific transcription initiation factor RRN3
VELEDLEEEDGQETAGANEVFELDPFDTDPTSADPDAFPNDESGSDGDEGDDFSDVSSEAYDPTDDFATPTQQEVDLPHIRDMMQKLDAVMKTLFEFFSSHAIIHTQPPTRPGSPNLSLEQQTSEMSDEEIKARHDTMFYTFLGIFDRVVLRTLKSKYTQFLVFWYTSLDPNYLDLFEGMLISKAFLEVETPLVIKVAATSYIASFVSRAAFVDKTHTRHIVKLLKQHLEDQLTDCEVEASLRPNTSRYATFYSVAQAMFLIFCFRWRDLADDTELDEDILDLGNTTAGHRKWIAELDILRKIVHSVLNPLKVCKSDLPSNFCSTLLFRFVLRML